MSNKGTLMKVVGNPVVDRNTLLTHNSSKHTFYRPRVVWCGVVWCGVVGCGVVWCSVVGCGVVWCGEVYGFTEL